MGPRTNRFRALSPMLQSADLARTIGWYEEVLGFCCTGREENWCRLERDGVAIMFMRNAQFGAPQATAVQYIYVEDVFELWNRIAGRVKAEWGPEKMPYGMFEFAIRDPDGYLLSFGHESGE
jgi:uncharacterized glyoxalase superfamily protein PhnB